MNKITKLNYSDEERESILENMIPYIKSQFNIYFESRYKLSIMSPIKLQKMIQEGEIHFYIKATTHYMIYSYNDMVFFLYIDKLPTNQEICYVKRLYSLRDIKNEYLYLLLKVNLKFVK